MPDVETDPDVVDLVPHLDHEFHVTAYRGSTLVDIHFHCADCDRRWVAENIPEERIEEGRRDG